MAWGLRRLGDAVREAICARITFASCELLLLLVDCELVGELYECWRLMDGGVIFDGVRTGLRTVFDWAIFCAGLFASDVSSGL
jgi:hypothetical protein